MGSLLRECITTFAGKKMNRPAFPNGSTPHGNRAKSRDQNLQSFGGFRMPQGNLDSTTPYPSDGPASRLYPPFNVPPHQRFRGAPRSSTAIAGDLRNNSSVDYCGDPFRNPAHQRVYPGYQDITSAESSSDHGGGINQQHHSQQRTQHPKGLRGKAAADYWRSYGKARKAEKIAGGEYVPKRKREDSNHPIQVRDNSCVTVHPPELRGDLVTRFHCLSLQHQNPVYPEIA